MTTRRETARLRPTEALSHSLFLFPTTAFYVLFPLHPQFKLFLMSTATGASPEEGIRLPDPASFGAAADGSWGFGM